MPPGKKMKLHHILIAGLFAFVMAVLVVVFICPQLAATRKSYFDRNNGRIRVQWVGFGRVYKELVEETDFSKLLKNLDLAELPADWKPANSEELGMRRLFLPQHVSYTDGKVAADVYLFIKIANLN